MSEHDFEPIRGLPGVLPANERLLWQGSPDWWCLAKRVFHVRLVGAYFLALLAWRVADAASAGANVSAVLTAALGVTLIAAACLAFLMGLAALIARTTVYSITSKRLVMRFGVALTKAINIPFTVIDAAGIGALDAEGHGNLAVSLKSPNKIAYLQLWPHARPDRLARPEPTLRALPDAKAAAAILASALLAHREPKPVTPQSFTVEKPSRAPALQASLV